MEPLRPISVNSMSLKRPAPVHATDDGEKRSARPRVLLTPPASSDGHVASDDVAAFKIPALPKRMRMMTPSSSTVAASSSPAPVSSPGGTPRLSKSGTGPVIRIELEDGITYAMGRHRTADPLKTHTAQIPQPIMSQLSGSTEAGAPVHQIYLPRTASHASRLHAVLQYSASTGSVRLVVAGQNGIRIRSKALKRRVEKGESVEFTPERDEQVKLDFYGCIATLVTPPTPVARVEIEQEEEPVSLFSPNSSPARPNLASLPPSSPPLEIETRETDRSSSPLSPMSEKAVLEDEVEVKAEVLAEALALEQIIPSSPVAPARPASRAASPVKEIPPIPADIDLPALIASTVVFSGSSKLSQPDLVKHLLEVSVNCGITQSPADRPVSTKLQEHRFRGDVECLGRRGARVERDVWKSVACWQGKSTTVPHVST